MECVMQRNQNQNQCKVGYCVPLLQMFELGWREINHLFEN